MVTRDGRWSVRKDCFRLRRLVGVEQERGEIQPQPVARLGLAKACAELSSYQRSRQRRLQLRELEARMAGVWPHGPGMHQERGRAVNLPHGGDGQRKQ